YIKLERHDIDWFFPVGGFGSDDEDRTKIIETAFTRSMEFYEVHFKKQNTWVIGDTPLDIDCGKAINAKTIAVATGNYSVEELGQYNPDAVFSDFSDNDRFVKLIRHTK
ncbi:MAG: HAD hydrolase-like protein, partial [Calditrichaeota bacterium]|nr:HAD hydrolase-like protein [Calditrichota bacterium]